MGKENAPKVQRLADKNYAEQVGQLQPRRETLVQSAFGAYAHPLPGLRDTARTLAPKSSPPQQRQHRLARQVHALLARSPQGTQRFCLDADEIRDKREGLTSSPHIFSRMFFTLRVETPCTYISAIAMVNALSERRPRHLKSSPAPFSWPRS